MTSAPIVSKVWSFCNTLRDDGVGYGDYLEQLTYLIFLKMAEEYSRPPYNRDVGIPKKYSWPSLKAKRGAELEAHYIELLRELGHRKDMLGQIFTKSQNKIQDPAKLYRLIDMIDEVQWVSMEADVKGDIYEGLLEKNAEDTKSGAGQYFTPRALIRAMVECVRPEPGKAIADPACGTGGFFLACYDFLSNPKHYELDRKQKKFLKHKTFHGNEIVANTRRLCLMNMFLHNIGEIDGEVMISPNDALVAPSGESYDYVLANPPFGKKSSMSFTNEAGEEETDDLTYNRQDFWATTSNKELNFVQHIRTMLKTTGRAAVVVPDNVLFEGGAGETVRQNLLKTTELHTILRLPTGIFYAHGVKANVLFFDNHEARKEPWTKDVWYYDYRTNIHHTLKKKPLRFDDLAEFIECYNPTNRAKRKPTWHEEKNLEGRWRKFSYEELIARDKTSLDVFWLKDKSLTDLDNLPEPDELAEDIIENLEVWARQLPESIGGAKQGGLILNRPRCLRGEAILTIKKLVSVRNVGRLVNCIQKGPEFNKYNLFFAENGRGKTTLCAVLRSLETGQHEHISERKTIAPVSGDPAAQVRLVGGKNANYSKQAWSVTVPEIAIFDATFVSQNVHAGEYVSRDQRANLLEVIIGQAGVTLAKTVNKLDEDIREKNGDIQKARKAVQSHLPSGAKLETFIELAQDPNIETKIEAKATERDAAKKSSEIETRSALAKVDVPALPPNMLPILGKTLPDISADAEKLLNEHIARHQMHDRGESWIAKGVTFIHQDACPFCGQGVTGLPLVDAYKQFFSDSYDALIAESDQLESEVDLAFGAAPIATMGKTIATNEAGVQFWKEFALVATTALDYEKELSVNAQRLRTAALALIKAKRAAPLTAIAPTAELNAALAEFTGTVEVLKLYNVSVDAANVAIAAVKAKAHAADLAVIEGELGALNLAKLRHDAKVKPVCEEYLTLTKDKEQFDKDKEAAKQALDQHADKMIGDYETTINLLLKGFGAGFSITNSKKTYVGGTPTSAYQILINNQAVDLGDGTTPIGQASFRTTLSAGDKSTLALAFFLARLEHDPAKADRVVVFDDPFNSQDRSRRERTAELLKKYGNDCAQLFLLSHDPFFLSLVHSKLPKAERHCLQLIRAPDNTTTIEEWDVEKETQDGYFRDHAALSSYLLNGARELIDIARKIRPVLEGYHRYRFPHQFPENEWLGDMIKRIRDSAGAHPMSPALTELASINDYSKKYHHDTNPGKADSEPLNDGELQGYVQRTLAIVGGY